MSTSSQAFRPWMALLPIGVLYLASLLQLISWSAVAAGTTEDALEGVTLTTTIPAERGAILDRHGLALAEDRCTWDLVVSYFPQHRGLIVGVEDGSLTPERVVEKIQVLADDLGIPFDELWQALMVNPSGWKVLRRGLSLQERDAAMQAMKKVGSSGLSLVQRFERIYPNGPVLSHVIGLIGAKGLSNTISEDRPNSGFEAGLDALLAGTPGKRKSIGVSGKHGVNPALGITDAIAGQSVRTSLDLELSVYAREQLVELMQEHNPLRSLAIAVDVKTGQILTLIGLPDYDANDPIGSMQESLDPFTQKTGPAGWTLPARWNIEPGSTFKPLMAAYALERGAITPEQRFSNEGQSYLPPNCLRKDAIPNAIGVPDKPMRAFEGIVYSSNIVFAKIARETGREGMANILDFYGYSSKPFSLVGLAQRFEPRRAHPRKDFFSMRSPDALAYLIPRMGYGHGFDVPPLQHAMALATIANGGTLLAPTLNPEAEPQVLGELLSPATTKYVREAMLWMVNKSQRKWLPHRSDFAYCGKSGTAQIYSGVLEGKYTSLFACFGPYEDPEVLVLVVAYGTSKVDRGGTHHFGSKVSGPAAANILYRALELRGSLPTNGNGGLDWAASAANLDG